MSLFEHGIHTEKCQYRAHVSVDMECVYCFSVEECLHSIRKHNPVQAKCFTFGQQTAVGYLIKPRQIKNIRTVNLPFFCWSKYNDTWSQAKKGHFGHEAFEWMAIKSGQIARRACVEDDISGIDYYVNGKGWQVKLDKAAGNPNLYIQIAEINPTGQH